MKKTFLQFLLFSGICLLLTACPYGSDVPIDEPTVKIDEKLIGKWEPKSSSDNFYVVSKKDDVTYKLEKKSKKSADVTVYTGFLSVVDGVRFMNVSEDDGSTKKYYLYKVEISASGAKTTLIPLTDNISEKFSSSAELKAYIKKYMALSFFYDKDQDEYFRAD